MESRYVFTLIFILVLLDLVALNCSFGLVCFFNTGRVVYQGFNFDLLAVLNISWLISTLVNKLYSYRAVQTNNKLGYKSLLTFCCQVALVIIAVISFKNKVSATFIIEMLTAEVVALTLIRVFIYFIQIKFPGLVYYKKKIAIVGHNELSEKLVDYFQENKLSFNLWGHFKYANNGQSQLGDFKKDIQFAIENELDEVYTTLFPEDHEEMDQIIKLAEQYFVRVRFVTTDLKYKHGLNSVQGLNYNLSDYYNGLPVLVNRVEPLNAVNNRILKRAFDIVFSLLVIVFLLSWLLPIMALIIKLESAGPTIFMQTRSGRNNKPFWCYKFRSMRTNKNSNQLQASKNDSRITRVGAFIRKTSIDELPQFFNVLFGDMSIVGPRPHMLKHTDEYREVIDQYMMRLYLKPGITGWAQVNGFRGETRDKVLMEKRIECDLWYMERWSVLFDIKIILLTVANIFKGEANAY